MSDWMSKFTDGGGATGGMILLRYEGKGTSKIMF